MLIRYFSMYLIPQRFLEVCLSLVPQIVDCSLASHLCLVERVVLDTGCLKSLKSSVSGIFR